MKKKILILKAEVEEELTQIKELVEEFEKLEEKEYEQNIKNRLMASYLTDYYMAMERIFKNIAREIDEDIPEGEEWHKSLLRQMSIEIPNERPPVISKELYQELEEYLRFQHLAKNIYGFQLKREKFSHLIDKLPETYKQSQNEIKKFINTREKIARKADADNTT